MKRHSLLFGINRYEKKNGFAPLICPTSDAEALADLLDSPGFVGDDKKVHLRLDQTKAGAEEDLRALLSSPGLNPKDDLVHIHFSGHGMRDDDGKFYLCFVDTVASELAFTGLNYERLKHWLEVKRIQRALITLDCCYSGAAIHKDAIDSGAGLLAKVIPVDEGSHGTKGKGYCVVTATGDRELAHEGKEGLHGNQRGRLSVFTHHMVEGIRSGEADYGEKGYVTASDLHRFVSARVKTDVAAMHPQIGGKTDGDILVAYNPKAVEKKRLLQKLYQEEDFQRRRDELARSVHNWLVKQFTEDVFDAAFVAEVEAWLAVVTVDMEGTPKFKLLTQAVERNIKAVPFHNQWRAAEELLPPSVSSRDQVPAVNVAVLENSSSSRHTNPSTMKPALVANWRTLVPDLIEALALNLSASALLLLFAALNFFEFGLGLVEIFFDDDNPNILENRLIFRQAIFLFLSSTLCIVGTAVIIPNLLRRLANLGGIFALWIAPTAPDLKIVVMLAGAIPTYVFFAYALRPESFSQVNFHSKILFEQALGLVIFLAPFVQFLTVTFVKRK